MLYFCEYSQGGERLEVELKSDRSAITRSPAKPIGSQVCVKEAAATRAILVTSTRPRSTCVLLRFKPRKTLPRSRYIIALFVRAPLVL